MPDNFGWYFFTKELRDWDLSTPISVSKQTYDGINYRYIRDYDTVITEDDGTYGNSNPYIYWFDARVAYHQYYPVNSDVHVSDRPVAMKSILINIEEMHKDK